MVNGDSEPRESLLARFPGREEQISLLWDLLSDASQPSPALVHLYDPNSPASTLELLRGVLLPPTVVVEIDPLVCPTPKSLFSTVWDALGSVSFAPVPDVVDDSIDLFLGALSTWVEQPSSPKSKLVFILRRAERLRDIWTEPIAEALYNLPEIISAKGRCSLVTVSTLPASHFRTTRGVDLSDALTIPFPRLSKQDAIDFLALDAEHLITSDDRKQVASPDALRRTHAAFIAVAYDSFASEIRDLDEIRVLACCVWYPFIEPLLQGVVAEARTNLLFSRSSFLFRDALARLHTREVSPPDWVAQMVEYVKQECQAEESKEQVRERPSSDNIPIALPLVPSYLLLASYLASYNPARMDVRYFVRDESSLLVDGGRNGHKSKRKGHARRGRKSEYDRQEMLGPKTFTLDRLLSIFQALMIEAGPELDVWMGDESSQAKSDWWEAKGKSVAVTEGVNTLIRLNTLVRTSAGEKLEGTTLFRANVTRETAAQVSRRAKFDLAEWLWDNEV